MGCLQRKPAAHPDSRESKPVGGSPKSSGSTPFHPDATVFTPVQFPVQRQRDPVGSSIASATGDLFRSSRRNSRARHAASDRRLPGQEQAAGNRPARPRAKCPAGHILVIAKRCHVIAFCYLKCIRRSQRPNMRRSCSRLIYGLSNALPAWFVAIRLSAVGVRPLKEAV